MNRKPPDLKIGGGAGRRFVAASVNYNVPNSYILADRRADQDALSLKISQNIPYSFKKYSL
jgi:hypothetical protein